MCCGCRTGFISNACARWRRATRKVGTRSASSTPWRRCWCAMPAIRRHRHHQYVWRHSVRRGSRDCRQPRTGGLAQCRREHAVAQAQHGSAPDIAGKNIANPASLIGSAAMLLAWLGERRGDDKLIARCASDRISARSRHRQPEMAHAGHGRSTWHRCLWRAGSEGGGIIPGMAGVTQNRKAAPDCSPGPFSPARRLRASAARARATRAVSILERQFFQRSGAGRRGGACAASRCPRRCARGCVAQPARERPNAGIGRVVGDAIGAGNLHPDFAGFQKLQQRMQRRAAGRARSGRNGRSRLPPAARAGSAPAARSPPTARRSAHASRGARKAAAASMSRRIVSIGAAPKVAILTRRPRTPWACISPSSAFVT